MRQPGASPRFNNLRVIIGPLARQIVRKFVPRKLAFYASVLDRYDLLGVIEATHTDVRPFRIQDVGLRPDQLRAALFTEATLS